MTQSTAERYVRLGLQLGRHVDGIVDAYFGPPELAHAVAAEPPSEPRLLVAAADELLADLDDGWLRDQVAGARTYAGVLAGEGRSYADEVEGCYGVRPSHTDEAVFAAAHERLDELLPAHGPLAERYERWERSIRVPAAAVERTVAAVVEEARAATRRLVELPPGEAVAVEIVRRQALDGVLPLPRRLALGIAVNVDLPMSAIELLRPHHARDVSRTPHRELHARSMCSYAAADCSRRRWCSCRPRSRSSRRASRRSRRYCCSRAMAGRRLADVVHDAGIDLDLAHALAVDRALEPCRWADVNAALMLYDDGAGEPRCSAYLERWGLDHPEARGPRDPLHDRAVQRTYIHTDSTGRELRRATWWASPSDSAAC